MKKYQSNVNHVRYDKPTNEQIQDEYYFPCSITVLNLTTKIAEVFYYDKDGVECPLGKTAISADYLMKKGLLRNSPAPTIVGLYPLIENGIYVNLGGINATPEKLNFASYDGNSFNLVEIDMPTPNITNVNNNYSVDPEQIVPSEALYNDETLAGDILKRVDKTTGENVNYRETTTWHDGSVMDDSKVDEVVYIKKNNKYFKLVPNGFVNVKWLGAKGDGITDDSIAFQLAVTFFENIYVPKGNYLCNIDLPRKINIKGDGSLYSRLIPKDQNKAVMIYKNSAPYWTYNTKIEGIGFWNTNLDGSPKKTGVGFTFGYTDLNNPVQGAEFYTNVTFQNCYWFGFERAVLTPTGNIGVDFINCGSAGNKYAFYFLDAKHFGEIMHAGCKTFLGGEFSGNDVVCYIDNKQNGFGQIIFRNVIFEMNKIVCYANNTDGSFTPTLFDGCWDEGNGFFKYPNQNFNVDIWTDGALSTTPIQIESFILKGEGEYHFVNGRVASLDCDGNVNVIVENCIVEETEDYVGSLWYAKNGANIELIRCRSYGANPKAKGIVSFYPILSKKQISIAGTPDAKTFVLPPRFLKSNVKNSFKKTLEVAENLVGTFSVQGNIVQDGVIFENCNEWQIPFSNNSDIVILNTGISLTNNKFFFISIDIKADKLPNIVLMNDAGKTIGRLVNNSKRGFENKWITLGFAGFANEDVTNVNLWLMNGNGTTNFRASAIQFVQFDEMEQMKAYLNSSIFPL